MKKKGGLDWRGWCFVIGILGLLTMALLSPFDIFFTAWIESTLTPMFNMDANTLQFIIVLVGFIFFSALLIVAGYSVKDRVETMFVGDKRDTKRISSIIRGKRKR